jgi:hypothetical protein
MEFKWSRELDKTTKSTKRSEEKGKAKKRVFCDVLKQQSKSKESLKSLTKRNDRWAEVQKVKASKSQALAPVVKMHTQESCPFGANFESCRSSSY